MLKKLATILQLALLCGCANVQDAYGKYKDGQEVKYITQAKISCERYGFSVGTEVFANCVDKNVNAEKDRDAVREAEFYKGSKK